MTFDMIFMILCLFLGGYGIYTGIRLKQGYDMPITGYTAMPEEDKRYYDDQKVKKYAAIMNIAAGCGLMGCSIFGLGKDLLFSQVSLLEAIRCEHRNWLEIMPRLFYNFGGSLVSIPW